MSTRSETYLAHQLMSLIADHYEISLKDLVCSKAGKNRLARGSAIFAIRKHTNLPLTSIASLLGYETSEMVWYALKQHEVDIRRNVSLHRVQFLVETFVNAAVNLQAASEKEMKSYSTSEDTAWLIDDILDDCI